MFGYKCGWLAVFSKNAERVADAVGATRSTGWEAGVAAAYTGAVFVTPEVDGWTFVVSTAFADEDHGAGARARVPRRRAVFERCL